MQKCARTNGNTVVIIIALVVARLPPRLLYPHSIWGQSKILRFPGTRTRICEAVMVSVSLFCMAFILSGSITLATGTNNHNYIPVKPYFKGYCSAINVI